MAGVLADVAVPLVVGSAGLGACIALTPVLPVPHVWAAPVASVLVFITTAGALFGGPVAIRVRSWFTPVVVARVNRPKLVPAASLARTGGVLLVPLKTDAGMCESCGYYPASTVARFDAGPVFAVCDSCAAGAAHLVTRGAIGGAA